MRRIIVEEVEGGFIIREYRQTELFQYPEEPNRTVVAGTVRVVQKRVREMLESAG